MAEQDPRMEHVYREIMPILQEWEKEIFPAIKNLEVKGLKEYATAERILCWIDRAKVVIEKHSGTKENLSKYVRIMVDNMYSNCIVQKAHIETEKRNFEESLTKLWTGDSLVKERLERTEAELEAAKKDLEWLRTQHRMDGEALEKEGSGMQNLRAQLEDVTKRLDGIKFQLEEKDRILADANARLKQEEELRERAYRDLGEVKARLGRREEKVRIKVRKIRGTLHARYAERQAALEQAVLETKKDAERRYEELKARYDDVIAQLGEFKKEMMDEMARSEADRKSLAVKYEAERARAEQTEKKMTEMQAELDAAKKEAYMLRGVDQIKREIAEKLEEAVESYVAQDWRSLIDFGRILDAENYKYVYDELERIRSVAAKIGEREREMGGSGSYVLRFIRWLGYARRMSDFGGILDITAKIAEKDAYSAVAFFTGPAMRLGREKVKSLREKSAEEALAEL